MHLVAKIKEFSDMFPGEAPRSKYKDADYLALMCHEIGTPLHVILGLSHALAAVECSPEKKKEYAEMLRASSTMLMELLKNMLDASRMDADMLEIEHIDFDLAKTVQEAAHIITAKAAEKGLKVYVHMASGLPAQCMGDPLRLRQILLNLLSNAVKFTEKGHVAVYVNTKIDVSGRHLLSITVADTGMGIPQDALGKIFGKYAQGDATISRKYGGTGLGLSISHDLACLMQGSITVKSWPGIGSRFVVTLPLRTTPA